MRTVRDGQVVISHDPDESTDDSDLPRTVRDQEVVHEGSKAIAEPPADKAVKAPPQTK